MKTLLVVVTHFHVAFTKELMDSGSLETEPPWIPLMKTLGINIAHIFDFHGDGHPNDPGPLRLTELENSPTTSSTAIST